MAKIKIAEIFHSLQGEGLWVGQPSVFIRTFGCNFECRGFGLSDGQRSKEPEEFAEEYKLNPHGQYKDLPLAKTGCDSYASWHKGFKSLSRMLSTDAIINEMELARETLSCMVFNNGSTHLVITGGEPLLGWQRAYPELLIKAEELGYKQVTFETNGTQEIKGDFKDYLIRDKLIGNTQLKFTFSVSPKLFTSGEEMVDALKPEIVADYQRYGVTYLKFVLAKHSDMRDVVHFVNEYRDAGFHGEIYLMPCGGTQDTYNMNAPEVARLSMVYGFRYSPRLQVDLYKNAHGT